MKTSLKDWPKVYRKLKGMSSLDEHEKILSARFAAATPDDRIESPLAGFDLGSISMRSILFGAV